jgi:hypothetical protein
MTLAERIQESARRSGIAVCQTCGIRHAGAAWSPMVGWHDAPGGRTVADLIPLVQSPFTRAALAAQLPVKELAR